MLGPDRLAFTHPFPGRVITLELDGTPVGDIHYRPTLGSSSSYVALQMIHGTRDRLVLGGTSWETDGEKGKNATGGATEVLFIAHCDADGQELSRCLEQRREIDYSGELIDELDHDRPWDRVALSRDGYLFVAPDRNRYLIEVFAPGGELQHTIDRDAGGLERSSEQLAAVRRDLQARVRYYKNPPREIRVCSTEPCVTGLWPRPDRSLWVRTSQGDHQARTVGAVVLNAHDETGRFQNQVLLDFPFDPAADDRLLPDRRGRELRYGQQCIAQRGVHRHNGQRGDATDLGGTDRDAPDAISAAEVGARRGKNRTIPPIPSARLPLSSCT